MFNRDGITRVSASNRTQILANVDLQSSVGCRVSNSYAVDGGDGHNYIMAGTPLRVDLVDRNEDALLADGDTTAMNAVLLHDVDVTNRTRANATVLVFGFVDLDKVTHPLTKTRLSAAMSNAAASPLLTFMSGTSPY